MAPYHIGHYRWEWYVDVVCLPLQTSHMLYLINLICDEQFSGQQGLPNPSILFWGVNQNDWHTPCHCCGHTPVYYYAERQVMVFSLLNWAVILDGNLLACPSTVTAELLGTQTGFFFEPIMTCPMAPVFSLNFCWSVFRQVICLWGLSLFNFSKCCSQCLVLFAHQNSRRHTIGKIIKDWLLHDTQMSWIL